MLIFSGTFGEAFAATHGVHPSIAKTACSVRPSVTTAAYAHVVNGQSAALDSKTSVRLTGDPAYRPPNHHRPAKHHKSPTPSKSATSTATPSKSTATTTPSTSATPTAPPTPRKPPTP